MGRTRGGLPYAGSAPDYTRRVVRIAVRAHARASQPRLRWDGEALDVWVNAPPAAGAANRAIIKAIADWLDVPPSSTHLVAGERGRSKLVQVDGIEALPLSD